MPTTIEYLRTDTDEDFAVMTRGSHEVPIPISSTPHCEEMSKAGDNLVLYFETFDEHGREIQKELKKKESPHPRLNPTVAALNNIVAANVAAASEMKMPVVPPLPRLTSPETSSRSNAHPLLAEEERTSKPKASTARFSPVDLRDVNGSELRLHRLHTPKGSYSPRHGKFTNVMEKEDSRRGFAFHSQHKPTRGANTVVGRSLVEDCQTKLIVARNKAYDKRLPTPNGIETEAVCTVFDIICQNVQGPFAGLLAELEPLLVASIYSNCSFDAVEESISAKNLRYIPYFDQVRRLEMQLRDSQTQHSQAMESIKELQEMLENIEGKLRYEEYERNVLITDSSKRNEEFRMANKEIAILKRRHDSDSREIDRLLQENMELRALLGEEKENADGANSNDANTVEQLKSLLLEALAERDEGIRQLRGLDRVNLHLRNMVNDEMTRIKALNAEYEEQVTALQSEVKQYIQDNDALLQENMELRETAMNESETHMVEALEENDKVVLETSKLMAVADIPNLVVIPSSSQLNSDTKVTQFEGLGTGSNVPKFMRWSGPIRKRDMHKRDVEATLKDIWNKKLQLEGHKPLEERQALLEFFADYMMQKYGFHNLVVESTYNFLYALQQYVEDADCELFLKVLRGEIPEETYSDQLLLIEKLKGACVQLDIGKRNEGELNGKVNKGKFLAVVRGIVGKKDDASWEKIVQSLEKEFPKSEVPYNKVFAEDRNGNQTAFVEELRDQTVRESIVYVEKVRAAISRVSFAAGGLITLGRLKEVILAVDPNQRKEVVNRFLTRGIGKNVKKARVDDTFHAGAFLENMTQRFVKHTSFADLRRALQATSVENKDARELEATPPEL